MDRALPFWIHPPIPVSCCKCTNVPCRDKTRNKRLEAPPRPPVTRTTRNHTQPRRPTIVRTTKKKKRSWSWILGYWMNFECICNRHSLALDWSNDWRFPWRQSLSEKDKPKGRWCRDCGWKGERVLLFCCCCCCCHPRNESFSNTCCRVVPQVFGCRMDHGRLPAHPTQQQQEHLPHSP